MHNCFLQSQKFVFFSRRAVVVAAVAQPLVDAARTRARTVAIPHRQRSSVSMLTRVRQPVYHFIRHCRLRRAEMSYSHYRNPHHAHAFSADSPRCHHSACRSACVRKRPKRISNISLTTKHNLNARATVIFLEASHCLLPSVHSLAPRIRAPRCQLQAKVAGRVRTPLPQHSTMRTRQVLPHFPNLYIWSRRVT
jgi:hypothetical protein